MDASHDSEEWRPIPGIKNYEASSLGRIKRIPKVLVWKTGGVPKKLGRCLKPWTNKKGYLLVDLGQQGRRKKRRTCTVHSLVALAFHGPRPKGYEIDHKDHNKANNRPDNLEYVTPEENMRRAVAAGLMDARRVALGTQTGNAKLTDEDVIYALERRRQGASVSVIAGELMVSDSNIYYMLRGDTWGHLTGFKAKDGNHVCTQGAVLGVEHARCG